MNASSGWDYKPSMPQSAPSPVDHSEEPIGYNLSDAALYEQPPPPPEPYRLPSPIPMRSGEVFAGFGLGVLGLALVALMPVITLPISGAGVVGSTLALFRSRRARSSVPWLAVVGLVLGIVGVAIAFLLLADVATGYEVVTPS